MHLHAALQKTLPRTSSIRPDFAISASREGDLRALAGCNNWPFPSFRTSKPANGIPVPDVFLQPNPWEQQGYTTFPSSEGTISISTLPP